MTASFRALMSFHYIRASPLVDLLDRYFGPDRDDLELFLDSGAFSAWSQGASIDVHDYGRWLVANDAAGHCVVIANLDVIGRDDTSAQATYRNQKILEDDYGLTVLPVVHAGEPFDWVTRYIDEGYRYIALGGLVGQPWKHAGAWVNQAFKLARARGATPEQRADALAAFHGFGLTSNRGLREFPWYSVDSSSWGAGYRYGNLKVFSEDAKAVDGGPGIIQVPFRDLEGQGATSMRYRTIIRSYGFDPDHLRQPGRSGRAIVSAIAAVAFQRQERWLRAHWGPVAIPGDAHGPGIRMYAADGSADNLALGREGICTYLATSNLADFPPARAGMRGEPVTVKGEPS